ILDVEQPYRTQPIAHDHTLALVIEGGDERQVIRRLDGALLLTLTVPDFDVVVATGGDETAIVGVSDGQRTTAMGVPVACAFAIMHRPQSHLPVFTDGGEDV